MDEPRPPGRPFPPLLFWALLVPAFMFLPAGALVFLAARASTFWGQSPFAEPLFAAFVVPMMMEPIAVLVAIVLLVRGGYRTKANCILTWVGAIPPVVFVGMWIFSSLSHVHF